MSETAKCTIKQRDDGKWQREKFVDIPPHEPFPEYCQKTLDDECNRACVQPIKVRWFCSPSGKLISLKLMAEYSSKEEAESKETASAFDRSRNNIAMVLEKYLPKPLAKGKPPTA